VEIPIKHPADESRPFWVMMGATCSMLQVENLLLLGKYPDVARAYMMKFPSEPPGAHVVPSVSCYNKNKQGYIDSI
jgi:hypothetical protein